MKEISLDSKNNPNQEANNDLTIIQPKMSLFSLDNGQNNEDELSDLERKVVEESPKGRFQRFEEELGSGSQKRVFLAYDTDTGCEVAWNSVLVDIKTPSLFKK